MTTLLENRKFETNKNFARHVEKTFLQKKIEIGWKSEKYFFDKPFFGEKLYENLILTEKINGCCEI